MSRLSLLLFGILFCTASSELLAQPAYADTQFFLSSDFSDCSAIFYNDRLLVDEYSPDGKCQLEMGMKGKITLAAVRIQDEQVTPTHTLDFRVVIRHYRSKTLWMYTPDPVHSVQLEDILSACQNGDQIFIMAEDKLYALPHNEIKIRWGC